MTRLMTMFLLLMLPTVTHGQGNPSERWWFLGYGKDAHPLVMLISPAMQTSSAQIKSATLIYIFKEQYNFSGMEQEINFSGMKQEIDVDCTSGSINDKSTQLLSSGQWSARTVDTTGYIKMEKKNTPYAAILFLCEGDPGAFEVTGPPLEIAEELFNLLADKGISAAKSLPEKDSHVAPTPRPLAPTGVRPGPSTTDPARGVSKKYQECVYAAARQLASSKETAPVVAQSAVQSCSRLRAQFYRLYAANKPYTTTEAFFARFDNHVMSEAQLATVRARSKSLKR